MTTPPRVAALALLAGLVTACSAGDGSGGYLAVGARAGAAPPTVEQLSARVGCEPRLRTGGAGVRSGHCATPDGEFVVTTFATRAGRDAWMSAAPAGTPHLTGDLWTVLSSRKVLDLLSERLGGEVHMTDPATRKMRVVG
ncbi:hypothetical protein E1267_27020 [Nonomuraea longispora]|uniref:Lipoprotein n=1 Tax=Nonomuraea longispora TaxID=1848320 RepID=A0A4R4N5I7_9ACTN|nr:hypothetical protein [Nonomuraea longispora]TDC03224.1 hypothetical protein E1267_27020 [Nonomuraea longispora]